MKEKASGLAIKLITSVLLLSVLLCAAISYMGYREFTTVLEDEYNRSAYEIAETARTYLDATTPPAPTSSIPCTRTRALRATSWATPRRTWIRTTRKKWRG